MGHNCSKAKRYQDIILENDDKKTCDFSRWDSPSKFLSNIEVKN